MGLGCWRVWGVQGLRVWDWECKINLSLWGVERRMCPRVHHSDNRKSLTTILTSESVFAHPVRDRAQRSCFCSVTLFPSICSRAQSVQSGSPGLHIVQMMTFETRQNPWYDHFWPFAPIKWWFYLVWASVNACLVNQWTFRVQHQMQWTKVTPSQSHSH